MTSPSDTLPSDLRWLAKRIGQASGGPSALRRRDMQHILAAAQISKSLAKVSPQVIHQLFAALRLRQAFSSRELRAVDLPAVALLPSGKMRFVYGHSASGEWLSEDRENRDKVTEWMDGTLFFSITPVDPLESKATAKALFAGAFERDLSWTFLTAIASVIVSLLVLGASLYSMQVYDRVIGQGGVSTLIVLTVGVLIAIVVEFIVKLARARITERAINEVDLACSQGVFARLLRIRIDQFPSSIGTLSAQVRGFEPIRAFQSALRIYLLTDAPFALLFLGVIYALGGPLVAAVPTVSLVVAIAVGLSFKVAVQRHSRRMVLTGNRRQGLLVEVITAAETIKATGAAWLAQARWNDLSKQNADESSEIKHLNETSSHCAALIQQIGYVSLVAVGAYVATTTQSLSVGAIIACSIISGRVLTPINQIPGLLVQWAHARVAMDNLEKLFQLETDNYGVQSPYQPETVAGTIEMVDVEFAFPGQLEALKFSSLRIKPGERVAILGSIGTGKSTLLKLVAGLVRSQRGQVLLDGMDVQHIDAERRSELIGYLPQQTRLIGGSLRDNLCLGVQHYSEEQILKAAQITGLSHVIASRPEGLDFHIPEGGEGLSGGQKQLVALTRMALANPLIWLLDEPTASLDDMAEVHVMNSLKAAVQPHQSVILVTHKLRLLELVDRIVVLSPKGIVMDGPRDALLQRLQGLPQTPAASNPVTVTSTTVKFPGQVAPVMRVVQ